MELINKALSKDPQNGAYLDSLGWVYFKKKDYNKAVFYLKKAADKLRDPLIFEHLGDAYFAIGDYKKAKFWWLRSLELEKNPQVEKKLERVKDEVSP